MAPFQPGDVVVCVNDRAPRWNVPLPFMVKRGRFYRVTEAFSSALGNPLVLLNGQRKMLNAHGTMTAGWAADRFRKIDDETAEEFRQQMRALGKVRERANA